MEKTASSGRPILLVDDDRAALDAAERLLASEGFGLVSRLERGSLVMKSLAQAEVEAILLDLSLPDVSGADLISEMRAAHPEVPVIVVTGTNEIDTAVRCMRDGAFDYLVKPVEPERLLGTLRRAIGGRRTDEERRFVRERFLSGRLEHPGAFERILTRDPRMQSLFLYVEAVARSTEPILMIGETGVGKELFAEAIHLASGRPGPLVAVNVAGLDDLMFSDSLFGHRRGAYTGADELRAGLVHEASRGTLFLDEIGDLSESSQVKLLRLVENGQYYPVGSDSPRRCEARFVFSTHLDLRSAAAAGKFRKDLYYRIGVHELRIPPLRERRGDIPLLAGFFAREAERRMGTSSIELGAGDLSRLVAYDFPGNVRELRSMLFDAVSRGSMPELGGAPGAGEEAASTSPSLFFGPALPTLREAEELLVDEALSRADGRQAEAARILGISHQALSKRLAGRREARKHE